ncbi:MAG: hypothetical protein HBSAPP03_08560 [Phycisphaerae bacterium]|nr:MAG: hypothetical protein HBSAPP03_08560 [Phycisphaerae bacterium]
MVRLVWAALACVMISAWPAWAQHVEGQAGPMGTMVPRRSLATYARLAGMTPDQREQVGVLYDGYRAAYFENRRACNAKAEALSTAAREAGGSSSKDRGAVVLEYVDKAEALERAFFEDMKAVLTPAQSARFDRVERARRREVGLRFAFSAGSNVDLFDVAEVSKVALTGPVLEAFDRYEADMDRALVNRLTVLKRVFSRVKDEDDIVSKPAVMQELVRDLFEAGFRVRDVNRRAVREIAPLLDESTRAAFEAAHRARAMPRVFGPGAVETLIAKVRAEAGLTAEATEELGRLEAAYRRDVGPINARLATEIENREVEYTTRFAELMDDSHAEHEPGKVPLYDAWKARRDLDEGVVHRLSALIPKGRLDDAPPPVFLDYRHVAEPDFDEEERRQDSDDEQ